MGGSLVLQHGGTNRAAGGPVSAPRSGMGLILFETAGIWLHKIFYRSQGIPWIFHNLRRFLSGPATMLDPVGLFSPRDAIVHHVLQTFHRHPLYDLVLLRAHEDGMEEMARAGRPDRRRHPPAPARAGVADRGRLVPRAAAPRDRRVPRRPAQPARSIPPGWSRTRDIMLAMDQFKDIARLHALRGAPARRMGAAIAAWLAVGFDESIGSAGWELKLGPRAHPGGGWTDVRIPCPSASLGGPCASERSNSRPPCCSHRWRRSPICRSAPSARSSASG